MTSALPWPEPFAGTPALEVIERGIVRGRLGHSLLLHGDDSSLLGSLAEAIADRLLRQGRGDEAFAGAEHPDCFTLRPAGKMRIISADATRELIGAVQKTASVGARKVAIVHEADRMNLTAANVFLKTLEEPPANTTILLLSTRPYALLPTIRSRCLHFRFSARRGAGPAAESNWARWGADYRSWLAGLGEKAMSPEEVSQAIFGLYGLVARFGAIIEIATQEEWEKQKDRLPADLEEEEQIALEASLAVAQRSSMLSDVASWTRDFARERLVQGDNRARKPFIDAIGGLEHSSALLRLNLNELAALEDFMLASLRLWSKR